MAIRNVWDLNAVTYPHTLKLTKGTTAQIGTNTHIFFIVCYASFLNYMYKIEVTKTGIGWEVLLLKKWWIFWIPDTVNHIKQGYEYRVDKQINEWIEHFDIPHELVSVPK